MSRQRGQILPLVAILSTVLAGFVGLVIDVGGVTAGQEDAQAAADGAALAAASSIGQGGSIATATSYAQAVLAADGMPASRLTLSFLDSTGAVTANTTLVATVSAGVSYQRTTQFLSVLGVGTTGIASAATGVMPAANCGVCLFGSGSSLVLASASTLTVRNAGVAVNSTANRNLDVGSGAALAAQFVAVAANRVRNLGSISPAPIVRAAVADPYAALAVPSLSGGATAVDTASTGSGTISPGIYSTINVDTGTTLTLSAGVYVITGGVTVQSGGTLTGAGVTLYFACSSYPAACASGQVGSGLANSGATSLSASNTGTYAGVAIFADRRNAAVTVAAPGSSLSLRGAFYAIATTFVQAGAADAFTLASQLVLASMAVNGNVTVDLVPSLR